MKERVITIIEDCGSDYVKENNIIRFIIDVPNEIMSGDTATEKMIAAMKMFVENLENGKPMINLYP